MAIMITCQKLHSIWLVPLMMQLLKLKKWLLMLLSLKFSGWAVAQPLAFLEGSQNG